MTVYQEKAYTQNAPSVLLEESPQFHFKSEQVFCPVDGQALKVLKTYPKRIVTAIGIGTFEAHHTVLHCPNHPELGMFKSEELAQLVPSNSNVAYNVIVKAGQLRFQENRQVDEIVHILNTRYSVILSRSEIELLINKFIFYLAAVHQESEELIKTVIAKHGGFILHLDSTCDGDSPKLISSIDPISGFVLHSVKLCSENKDDVAEFLHQVKRKSGVPLAVISDMSKGIGAAVAEVYDGIAHYQCHFHFLNAIGKMLFEKENDLLRKTLSNGGISGKLKEMKRKLMKELQAIDNIDDHLLRPQECTEDPDGIKVLNLFLIQWILDHGCEGNGYGFPFDHRYLAFYNRLCKARVWITEITKSYPTETQYIKLL